MMLMTLISRRAAATIRRRCAMATCRHYASAADDTPPPDGRWLGCHMRCRRRITDTAMPACLHLSFTEYSRHLGLIAGFISRHLHTIAGAVLPPPPPRLRRRRFSRVLFTPPLRADTVEPRPPRAC